jgi:5,10-methylenetetrahydromethanopterin reductase
MTDHMEQPGLMLSGEMRPAEFVEAVQLAESVGYSELWYTDQRFWRDCYSGLTLAAQHSERMLLGPGVNDPFTRHPATIAMAIATLDELTNGRAQLGLGIGGSGIREMKIPKERPVRALRECIEIVNSMLSQPHIDYEGELYFVRNAKLGFPPVRSHIPTFVATHSPQTLRLSGRIADGVLLGNMARPSAVEEATEIVRNGENKEGRPSGSCKINLRLEALISNNPEPAFERMKQRFAARMIASYPRWEYLARLEVHPTPEMHEYAEKKDQEGLANLLKTSDVQSNMLVGTIDDVIKQLVPLLRMNVDKVTIRPYAMQNESMLSTIEHFCSNVWPAATKMVTP